MTRIANTSSGFLGKLFGKDHLIAIHLADTGFTLEFRKAGELPVTFEEIRDIRTRHYFDKKTPYRVVVLNTTDGKSYELEADPYNGDTQKLLQHYASFQLGQEQLPENINDLSLLLEYVREDTFTRIENGELILTKKGQETRYQLADVERYKIDAGAGWIGFKFPNKTLYVTVGISTANNIWLLHTLMQTYFDKAGLLS